MVVKISKFGLLMWKNWRIILKHKIELILEIILPALLLSALIIPRSLENNIPYPENAIFKPVDIKFSLHHYIQTDTSINIYEVGYYPKCKCLEDITKSVEKWLNENNDLVYKTNFTVVGYDKVEQLQHRVLEDKIIAGVEFDRNIANRQNCLADFTYSIRFPSQLREGISSPNNHWETNMLFPQWNVGGLRNKKLIPFDSVPSYYTEGFIGIQHAFAMAFIEKFKIIKETLPKILFERFPYKSHVYDPFLPNVQYYLPVLLVGCFMFNCIQNVKYISAERQNNMKETLVIMGFSNRLQWTTWFIKCLILSFTISIILTIGLKVPWRTAALLQHTDATVLLFFLLNYNIASISFSLMIVSFCPKKTKTKFITAICWLISVMPFLLIFRRYIVLGNLQKLVLSLFSNTAFCIGIHVIANLEGAGAGLQWKNIFTSVQNENVLSTIYVILLLVLDSILYILIALYMEKLNPGNYTIPENWYFPFTKKFWKTNTSSLRRKHLKPSKKIDLKTINDNLKSDAFEPEPRTSTIGVSIKNMNKIIDNDTIINNLSIDFYEDKITVLLGHNGSGKSTIISILIGLKEATDGSVIINGYDISKYMNAARSSLGFCPRHSILFEDLTVREHIIFFSRLKGYTELEVNQEIKKFYKLLDLNDKNDIVTRRLSVGEKRKVSVAMAFCGGSKVIVCDEPTFLLDPSACKDIWNILEKERTGRTILVSTNSLDEAEILADRIAILSNGNLTADATQFYLKSKFGSGYHLICYTTDECDPNKITHLLRRYIPDINIESQTDSEVAYNLPNVYSHIFGKMLKDLESRTEKLMINSYDISCSSLEEIFVLFGSDKGEKIINVQSSAFDNFCFDLEDDYSEYPLVKGIQLVKNQWKAMFLKKYLYTIRNFAIPIFQAIIPLICFFYAGRLCTSVKLTYTLQSLSLNFKEYSKSITVMAIRDYFQITKFEKEIANHYKNFILNFGNEHKTIAVSDNFINYILKVQRVDVLSAEDQYAIGLSISSKTITAFFNSQFYHSLPLSLNTLHNAIFKASTESGYSIDVSNHPFPMSSLDINYVENCGIDIAEHLVYGMAFCTAFFIIFQISERVNGTKLLQFINGINPMTFWLSQFIFDYGIYTIIILIFTLGAACYQQLHMSSPIELARLYFVLAIFGLAVLPITYLIAFSIRSPSSAFVILLLMNIITGFGIHFLTNELLENYRQYNLKDYFSNILLFPFYSLSWSIQELENTTKVLNNCIYLCHTSNLQPCTRESVYLHFGSRCIVVEQLITIGKHIVALLIIFILTLLFLILKEYHTFGGIWFDIKLFFFEFCMNRTEHLTENDDIDDDVLNEHHKVSKIMQENTTNAILVMDSVSKYYGKLLAVKNVSFAIEHSECFGLLGMNGAGKSTVFNILTGTCRPTYGEAYVKGYSIVDDLYSAYQKIGYCPEIDSLFEDLTGRENLKIFSLLRGIPESRIQFLSHELARNFGFMRDIDRIAKTYSAGTRRKLCLAMAFIGCPAIIYLDEPTNGLDPGVRRSIWNKITKVRDGGTSILLTSQNMVECETLCTRLAIMVNGEFQCLGSIQHLKQKFSKVFILKIRPSRILFPREGDVNIQRELRRGSIMANNKIIRFVKEEFRDVELHEQHEGQLKFYISLKSNRWSDVFSIMENNKESLKILDYSVTNSSLEEVFLEFVKKQRSIE